MALCLVCSLFIVHHRCVDNLCAQIVCRVAATKVSVGFRLRLILCSNIIAYCAGCGGLLAVSAVAAHRFQ